MRGFKFVAVFIMAIALSFMHCSAQVTKHTDLRIIKKQLTVGKNSAKVAPDCAWIQVGDTNTHKGLLLTPTDSTKIDTPYARGVMFYSAPDSTIKLWNGNRWRRLSLQ